MTVRPNSIVRNNEERSWAPRRFPWYIVPHDLQAPPRPIALSHRITYVPCRAAMAPWLLRYPRCLKRALQFFSLFSNNGSFGLQSCDGFISILSPKYIFSAQVCLKKNQNAPKVVVVVVVVDSHIQRIVLATEETTVTQQVSHRPIKCQSRALVVTKRYEGQRVTSW